MAELGTIKRIIIVILVITVDLLIYYWMFSSNFVFFYEKVGSLVGQDLIGNSFEIITFLLELFLILSLYGLLHSIFYLIYPDKRAGEPKTTMFISWLSEFIPFMLNLVIFFPLFWLGFGDIGFWGGVNYLIFVSQWLVWDGLGAYFALD